jgi:hypothetical protein
MFENRNEKNSSNGLGSLDADSTWQDFGFSVGLKLSSLPKCMAIGRLVA